MAGARPPRPLHGGFRMRGMARRNPPGSPPDQRLGALAALALADRARLAGLRLAGKIADLGHDGFFLVGTACGQRLRNLPARRPGPSEVHQCAGGPFPSGDGGLHHLLLCLVAPPHRESFWQRHLGFPLAHRRACHDSRACHHRLDGEFSAWLVDRERGMAFHSLRPPRPLRAAHARGLHSLACHLESRFKCFRFR